MHTIRTILCGVVCLSLSSCLMHYSSVTAAEYDMSTQYAGKGKRSYERKGLKGKGRLAGGKGSAASASPVEQGPQR